MSNPTPITVNENKASSKYIDRNPPLATDPDLNRKVVDYLAYLKEILNFSVATTGKRITDTSGYVNELVRTSNSLISTIYDTQNGLVSKVEQNANSISLVVDSTTDTINAASIVAAINDSGSTVIIDADHIELDGYVTFTNLATADGTTVINGGNIQANTLTLTSFDSTAQAALITGTTVKNQYYLSTSSSSATGGSWGDTVPAWSSGKYVWTRIRTTKTYANGNSSSTDSTGVYDENLTTALSTAASASTAASNAATAAGTAQTTADGALASTVSCYYRSTSSTTPTISTSTSIGTAVDTSNAWEYVLPRPKNGCYFFTCEKYTTKGGTVSFSTVRQMANATYTSLWCSSTDASYIDGAHIYAGSVTADRIAANETFTQNLTATNFNITGGSINITTTDATADVITLSYSGNSVTIRPGQIVASGGIGGASYARLLTAMGTFTLTDTQIGSSANLTKIGTLSLTDSTSAKADLDYSGLVFTSASNAQTAKYPASLTASRAMVTGTNGTVGTSSVTATELGYVSGVTSAIQTQINGKQASITGGASTIAASNLTASRALVSNSNGKVAVSSITSTKLGYLTDVTSNIQAQLDNKQASLSTSSGTLTFASGWTKVDGETDSSVLRYTHCRKYGKVVELAVSANTSSSHSNWNTICTIPSGYRPSHPFTALGYSNDNDSNAIFRVNTAGEVMAYGDKRQPTLHVSYVLD